MQTYDDSVTLEGFWSVIDVSQRAGAGDPERQRAELRAALARLPEREILDFSHHFGVLMVRAYRHDVWDAVWLLSGGCGDDSFHDFRDFLVACGRDIYEAVLHDPESLLDPANEPALDFGEMAFWSAADEAWRISKGIDPDDYDVEMPDVQRPEWTGERDRIRYDEHPSGDRIDVQDDDAVRKRFPRIWRHLHP
jgi:hypothetical protein